MSDLSLPNQRAAVREAPKESGDFRAFIPTLVLLRS